MVECKILRKGDSSDTVKSWQMLLNGWGEKLNVQAYNCGDTDGIFGQKTEDATKAFQGDYGLKKDGVVGADTWGMMLA